METLITRIKEIENKWIKIPSISDNLQGQFPGLTKNEILAFIAKCRLKLESAIENNQEINPIYSQQISTQITNAEAYVTQHLPSNPTPHLPGFFNILFALSTAIDQAVIVVGKDSKLSGITNKLQDKLTDSISKAYVVNDLLTNTEKLIKESGEASASLESANKLSQEVVTKIQERDRTTAELTSKINETEKRSLSLVSELEGNLSKVKASNEAIAAQQLSLEDLSKTLQSKLTEAQKLLEDANRHGLAGAFKTRKDELSKPAMGWVILFLLSIIGLCVIGFNTIQSLGTDWHMLLLRLPLTAPLIWLGWFSVRQYGFNKKIQEDYSFKVASAMSFQGYKNEVESDPELLALLRKSAIDNFSANPLRIYDDKNNHASPAHELLESLTGEKLTKIMEIAKILKLKQ